MRVRRLLTATPVYLKEGELITSMHLEQAQFTKLWSKKRLMIECVMHSFISLCGRQEEPAILISRLSLRMRRMYVASIRLDLYSISYPESSDFLTKKPEDSGYEVNFH